MKLIIDIPEEKYKTIQEGMYCGMLDADLYRDIKSGTPLDDIKKEIDKKSDMHMDGEFYIRNIDVKRILSGNEVSK